MMKKTVEYYTNRINFLKSKDAIMNAGLIKKLERQLRSLEN